MKKIRKKILALLMSICMIITTILAVPAGSGTVKAAETTSEIFTQNGFNLTIVQTVGNTVDSQVIEQIKEIYFKQYPKMRARYNPSRPKSITMVFDPEYDGVAYTLGTKIVFAVDWLKSNPNDVDCATHELFHVVQGGYKNYGSSQFATAFCEGVADYARSVYGLYNDEGGWSLPNYSSSQSYTDSYRVTARFLTWVQQTVDSSIIYNINKTMHAGTYTDDLWVQMTGKTVDQLWSEYAADPDINKIGLSGQKTESFGITSGETYKILSSESGMALSIQDSSTADGANVQQETYTGDESQQWVFTYLGDGLYNIINKKSGKGLDVADGVTSNGANIQQYTVENGGNNNQKWVVYERGNEYTLFPACGNGTMAADLTSSSHNAGANIQLYTWNKSKAQSFVIESINSSSEDDYTLKAFDRIEAEDFITCSPDIGVSVDEDDSRSRGANIGGLLAGAWTRYYEVVFDGDATAIEINYCNPSSDSYVNVYVDSMDGTPVGTIQTPHNSSDWGTYTSVTGNLTSKISSGTHDIYLEFKNSSMSGYAQNCDYFTFVKAPDVTDAYSQIQALSYSSQNGIVDDPSNIGGTHNGDWAAYNNVDFGEVSPATVKISYARNNSSCDGDGYVDVILDDINNSAVASVKLPSTAPNSWSNYIDIEGEVTGTVTGVHTVYLKFRGGSGNVANVSSFTFKQSSGIRDAFSTIEAESHDAYDGIIDYTTPVGYVGNTNADEWVRYDSVKFTETAKAVTFKYACNSSNAAGNVYIYLDGMENDPVGIVHFDPTAADWNNYVELKANLSEDITEGTHSVYFKFVPDDGKTYVANFDWFQFDDNEVFEIKTSGDIRIEGYQLSTTLGGNRVIGSVEPEINGKAVTEWGLIYGLVKANGKDNGITDDDLYVGAENPYIKAYKSTTEYGTINVQMGSSETATYFVRTMLFPANTSATFSAEYKVRAYALLESGRYVYSEVSDYSIFSVAEYLYANKLMNTYDAHQYLYNNILKIVDENYKSVDYEWGNAIVRPDETDL